MNLMSFFLSTISKCNSVIIIIPFYFANILIILLHNVFLNNTYLQYTNFKTHNVNKISRGVSVDQNLFQISSVAASSLNFYSFNNDKFK